MKRLRNGLVAPPVERTDAPKRITPPSGAQNWVLLILDSTRFDTFLTGAIRHLPSLGPIQRRWSYATWTAPSHYNLLMGLMPHSSPSKSFSAQVYRQEYARYVDRLGVEVDLSDLSPALWLPEWLQSHGWHTGAWVSLPVLNEATAIRRGFDFYRLRDRHNDFVGIVESLRFYDDRPSFWLLNTGETHYPYEVPGRSYSPLPRLSGVNGTLRRMGDPSRSEEPDFFSVQTLDELKDRQIEAVRYVDALVEALRDLTPDGTWLTVTSDHGECFGEDGYFGHGPIAHPKVMEVPFVEGLLR